MASVVTRFWILIAMVFISGFSQGMLLPLLAIILENNGVSSSVNGLHATGLYIGVLIASPFMEKPMQRFGFKPIIVVGGALVFLSLLLFPAWQSLWFWFILRLTIGIGDNMLHFGTQTWITTTSKAESRGRNIALYGLAFGLGFSVGPLMTRLLAYNEALPFLVSAGISIVVWVATLFVRNAWPDNYDHIDISTGTSSLKRFIKTGKIAWVALLPAFGYGFLEATLHGIFPVYGLRIGHNIDTLSIIIPFFAGGSILTQLPLGVLSDRYGRQKILLYVLAAGIITFLIAASLETSVTALFLAFALAGMSIGSLYSLSISFLADLLPPALLPAGNLLSGVFFSIGSISGPYLGGLFIEYLPGVSFFYLVVIMLAGLWIGIFWKRDAETQGQSSGV